MDSIRLEQIMMQHYVRKILSQVIPEFYFVSVQFGLYSMVYFFCFPFNDIPSYKHGNWLLILITFIFHVYQFSDKKIILLNFRLNIYFIMIIYSLCFIQINFIKQDYC